MKIKDLNVKDRPRERLMKLGPEVLTDAELLAIILGSGTKNKDVITLSKEIIEKYPFEKMKDLSMEYFLQIPGVKMAKASMLVALFEIVKRSFDLKNDIKEISCSKDIFDYIYNDFMLEKKEILIILYLDSKLRVLKKSKFLNYIPNQVIFPLRKIIEEAIFLNAIGIIMIHNHPSGDVFPSQNDQNVTLEAKKVLESVDLEIIDHLIINNDKYYSFSDNGILNEEFEYNFLGDLT